jgi:hypothetical protein
MKKAMFVFCMSGLLLTACNSGTTTEEKTVKHTTATASDTKTKAEEPWVAVDSATEMKAWMEYATPGEAHKAMAKSNGNWSGQVTMWMAIGAPPATSTSTMVNKMILGGRYQVSNYTGSFMGMPFEGVSTTAYDNYKKKYVNTWIDNMGSGIMHMEGTWDEATKSITYTGKMTSPANGRECNMKQVYKIIDDNNELMEMYGPDSKTGKEYKTMEMKLTRKK